MGFFGFTAVGIGAAAGAWLRWWFSHRLNPLFPTLPLGTLAANLLGAFLVGIAIAVFARHPGLSAEGRLFVITGFLGALTTFSTFSAEIVTQLGRGQYLWAAGACAAHLFGSLLLTALGILAVRWLAGP